MNVSTEPLGDLDGAGHVRIDQLVATLDLLLDCGAGSALTYDTIAARANAIVTALARRGEANAYVVRLWAIAPPSDWGHWNGLLADHAGGVVDPAARARVVVRAFTEFGTLSPEAQQEIPGQLAALMLLVASEPTDGEELNGVVTALEEAIQGAPWWQDEEAIAEHTRLHAAARQLGASARPLKPAIDRILAEDLGRAVPDLPGEPGTTEAVIEMAKRLPFDALAHISESLPPIDFDEAPDRSASALRIRVELAHVVKSRGSPRFREDPFAVATELIVQAANHGHADAAVSQWFGLAPAPAAIRRALRAARHRRPLPGEFEAGLQDWTATATAPQRTALIRDLVSWDEDTSSWIAAVASREITETTPLSDVRKAIRRARNQTARLTLARKAAALVPETTTGRKNLADLIVWLLGSKRPKADIEVAVAAAAGVQADEEISRRLSAAFKRACRRHGRKLTKQEARTISGAGIDVPADIAPRKIHEEIADRADEVRRRFNPFRLRLPW